MIDIKLISTPDGGDIDTSHGGIGLDRTTETAILLSLEGGNFDDTGDASTKPNQFWGNYTTNDTAQHIRSRTQSVLRRLPADVSNLKAVVDAVLLDLAWMRGLVVDTINANAKLVGRNRVLVEVDVTQNGVTTRYPIRLPWMQQAA
jgi:phage gp46-like protein